MLVANNTPSLDKKGYDRRVQALQTMFNEVLEQLKADGTYGTDPIGEAFVRSHEEPGRSWNMTEFNKRRRKAE